MDGSAANNGFRWGDYASMNVDPLDDCTFYFTTMYNPTSNWDTRVIAMEFDNCEALPETILDDGFEAQL